MEMEYVLGVEDEEMDLPPGFRFHPTDEELITHYLAPKFLDHNFNSVAIGEADFNKIEPWDLPKKAKMGEKEWYFFCVRDRKYPTAHRANRATEAGYWKATGKDREIYRAKVLVGMKKTLVFYLGRAPKGEKTNWVMHEFRFQGNIDDKFNHIQHSKKEWVITRVFEKNSGPKKLTDEPAGSSSVEELQASCLPELPPLTNSSPNNETTVLTTFSIPQTMDQEHDFGISLPDILTDQVMSDFDSIFAPNQFMSSLVYQGTDSTPKQELFQEAFSSNEGDFNDYWSYE